MTLFYIPIFTWYEVSYLDQSMEFVISKLLPAWVLLTPFPWPIWLVLAGDRRIFSPTFVMDSLPYPFSIGLLVSFISISNIFIWVHVIVGFATNATSKQWLSLVVHCKYIISNILTNMQYPMHAIHILMLFKNKLRKCNIVSKTGFQGKLPFSIISSWHGTPFPHSSWLTS